MLIVASEKDENYTQNSGMSNTKQFSDGRTACAEHEYADGVVNQPRTWGVNRSDFYNHFSTATKKLLKKEEQIRKPILRRVKIF